MSDVGLTAARKLSVLLKSDVERRVLEAIGTLRDDELGFTPSSYRLLAQTARCSEENVTVYVRRLEKAGLIVRQMLLGPTGRPIGNAFFLKDWDQDASVNPRWQSEEISVSLVDDFGLRVGFAIRNQVRLSPQETSSRT